MFMSYIRSLFSFLNKWRGLLIIITAAILIEMVSAAQYYFTYDLLEEQLEKRAESELTMKAILIRSTLNSVEDILNDHIWDIERNISHPDSMDNAVKRIVMMNRFARGAFMAYVPNYLTSKGRLFEPYALKMDNDIVTMQIASERHDYTTMDFYKRAMVSDKAIWVDPYNDEEGAQTMITSCVIAIRDRNNEPVGVAGVDMSLEWLSDTISHRHVYPSSFNLLLTEGGKTIARPSTKKVSLATSNSIANLINDSTVMREPSRSNRSQKIRFEESGKEGTVFYANMKGKPHWQIAVVCYDDEVYSALGGLRLTVFLLMLLAFAILMLMVRGFMRKERMLNKKSLEQERLNGELRIASNIQQALIAANDSSLANTKDLSVWGQLIPAKEVGGDLYNAFIRDEKLFFCIGDVSGKGIPSALIMGVTESLFRNIASRENNPAHIMTQLNETACRNNKTNIFVTMFVGVLDVPTGHLRYCNAGHEIPILICDKESSADSSGMEIAGEVSGKRECCLLDVKPNLPIGLFEDFEYEMQTINLQKGSMLFLYTDGLTESRNPDREQFGRERMLASLSECGTWNTRQTVEMMVAEMERFTGGTNLCDDLTMLAIRYSPVDDYSLLDDEITLINNVREVPRLNDFIKDVTERLYIGKSLSSNIRLAIEEAVVNVMEYAYPTEMSGEINVRVSSNGHRLKFIITDSGIAFNPTEALVADTTLTAEERPVGGLGILLVRRLMDSINYERIDGKNVLTLRKDYAGQEKEKNNK